MKKYILNIAFFFSIIFVVDLAFGLAMNYLNQNARSGGVAKRSYLFERADEDIIMFGSSRMCHHYVSSQIADSLGMTCFNAGEDGYGIVYTSGVLNHLIESGRVPKMIIYDVMSFDVYKDDNSKYLTLLKPYSNYPEVMEVIKRISANENLKLKSNLYKYNTVCLSTLFANLKAENFNMGYEPSYRKLDYEPKKVEGSSLSIHEIDTVKMNMMQEFIDKCNENNINLYFTLSPEYSPTAADHYEDVKKLSSENGIPFIDLKDIDLSYKREYFADPVHLNDEGAHYYTAKLISTLKEYI